MCRLICTFVVHIWLKQVFSWRGSYYNDPKIWTTLFYHREMCQKESDRMATVSSLIWVNSVCPNLSVPEQNRIIAVHLIQTVSKLFNLKESICDWMKYYKQNWLRKVNLDKFRKRNHTLKQDHCNIGLWKWVIVTAVFFWGRMTLPRVTFFLTICAYYTIEICFLSV